MNYIDLFSGAGGLSEGFFRAGLSPIAHIEKDKDACYTIQTRIAYHYLKAKGNEEVYFSYLKGDISRTELYRVIPDYLLKSVINETISKRSLNRLIELVHELKGDRDVDLIIGGPPCQAYSIAGRPQRKNLNESDYRNYLYKYYAQFLHAFKPKSFVFENVPGLYTADEGRYYRNMMKYFRRIGYDVDDRELDASDYGVLQKRRRVIIVGWNKKMRIGYPDFEKIANNWTVKDLFYDLPRLNPGDNINVLNYSRPDTNEYLARYDIKNGLDFVTQHITRPHNKRDLKIYRIAIDLWNEKAARLKNCDIPEQDRTQRNISSFLDRFKVVNSNGFSHTIIAHIERDGHYYIHPDKEQLRSLSVREAARIQSFPDDYYFEGSRTSAFRQIGNAVPPLMAESIAQKIISIIKSHGYKL